MSDLFADLPALFAPLVDDLNQDERIKLCTINALLPQTQCGLCGHSDGCLPYARAMLDGAPANLCVPGGQPTADALASLLQRPPLPVMPSKYPLDTDKRPIAMLAVIDENACIGCAKCLPACPTDAIVGTGKHLHSVIDTLCTGCELCLAPCPVDCIDMHARTQINLPSNQLQTRYFAHLHRLSAQIHTPTVSAIQSKLADTQQTPSISQDDAKRTLLLAKTRTRLKKLRQQAPTPAILAQIALLENELQEK